MSTRPSRWEPGSFSTDALPPRPRHPAARRHATLALAVLLLAAVPVGAGEACKAVGEPGAAVLAAEIELASRPDLYLVLDPDAGTLAIKARGTALETVPLAGASLLLYRPAEDEDAVTGPPRVWTVGRNPGPGRRRILPSELRRHDDAGEPRAALPSVEVDEAPPPPERYEVRLEGGFVLRVGPDLPASGFLARFSGRLADGWASLTGRSVSRPHVLALAMAPEEARRLYPLLRPGTRILLGGPE